MTDRYLITYIGTDNKGCDGVDVYYKVVDLEDDINILKLKEYLANSEYPYLYSYMEYSGIRLAIDEYSKNIAIACIQFRFDN